MAQQQVRDTQPCQRCKEVEKERKSKDSQPHSFSLHVDLAIFEKVKTKDKTEALKQKGLKKAQKKKTLADLERIVSALRNTLGGSILIHFRGHATNDLYLGHFDDFIGSSFKGLIQSGELYVEAYTRRWIYDDFLVITVTQSEAVSTVDFSTKVNTDFENANPSASNIKSILKKEPTSDIVLPRIRGITDNLQELHESRSIQLKCYMPKVDQVDINNGNYMNQVVEYIWNELKFKHNLTSMSKVDGGGSFYVGIEEKDITQTYECKVPSITGFVFQGDRELFEKAFHQKLEDNVTVLDLKTGAFCDNVKQMNLIAITFHDVNNHSVLEIAIRFFDGIIFYDKNGPRAYQIENDIIARMDRKEWLRKMTK